VVEENPDALARRLSRFEQARPRFTMSSHRRMAWTSTTRFAANASFTIVDPNGYELTFAQPSDR